MHVPHAEGWILATIAQFILILDKAAHSFKKQINYIKYHNTVDSLQASSNLIVS